MHHKGLPWPAPGVRRSGLLVGLLLATATALLGAGAALTDARIAAPFSDPSADAALVRAFYAAINDAVRTGDAADLDARVTPNVAWRLACPGQTPGRADLKRHLDDLHRTTPEARLAVESVVADGQGMVTARVDGSLRDGRSLRRRRRRRRPRRRTRAGPGRRIRRPLLRL